MIMIEDNMYIKMFKLGQHLFNNFIIYPSYIKLLIKRNNKI